MANTFKPSDYGIPSMLPVIFKIDPAVGLTFRQLQEANTARLPLYRNKKGELAHTMADGSDWTPAQWLQALVGEIGEYANFRKKYDRGDITGGEFAVHAVSEIADVATYLDLLSMRCLDLPAPVSFGTTMLVRQPSPMQGIDLGSAIVSKFNEVSKRVGANVFFEYGQSGEAPARVVLCKPECIKEVGEAYKIGYEAGRQDAPKPMFEFTTSFDMNGDTVTNLMVGAVEYVPKRDKEMVADIAQRRLEIINETRTVVDKLVSGIRSILHKMEAPSRWTYSHDLHDAIKALLNIVPGEIGEHPQVAADVERMSIVNRGLAEQLKAANEKITELSKTFSSDAAKIAQYSVDYQYHVAEAKKYKDLFETTLKQLDKMTRVKTPVPTGQYQIVMTNLKVKQRKLVKQAEDIVRWQKKYNDLRAAFDKEGNAQYKPLADLLRKIRAVCAWKPNVSIYGIMANVPPHLDLVSSADIVAAIDKVLES